METLSLWDILGWNSMFGQVRWSCQSYKRNKNIKKSFLFLQCNYPNLVVFKDWYSVFWRTLRLVQEFILKSKNHFYNTTQMLWAFLLMVQESLVSETSDMWTWIKALTPSYISSHCILICYIKLIHSSKNVLPEVLKIINFVKSQPLATHPVNILCDEMRSMHKALLLLTKVWELSQGKAVVWLFEWQTELTAFFMEFYFSLKEWSKEKL